MWRLGNVAKALVKILRATRLTLVTKMDTSSFIRLLGVGTLLGLAGCRGGPSLMPLDIGHKWTYIVKSPRSFDTYVTPIKVARRISVAGVEGVELTSDLGVSRLAWVGDGLMAERLIGTQFSPPLPLVFGTNETYERPWKGQVTFVDNASPATATQSQKAFDDFPLGGKKIHTIISTIHLKTAARSIELLTWFAPGRGIVQQEQRTDGTLLVRLSLLEQ
jgi:hypothetical protein